MSQSYIHGLELIPEVENAANSTSGVRNYTLAEMFSSSDLYEMPIDVQSPEHTQYLAPNPTPSFMHVSRESSKGKNDRVSINSQVGQGARRAEDVYLSLVEPYCNVPPIPVTVDEADEEGTGSGGDIIIEDGIYGQGGISGDIEEDRVFRSKKELMTCLSIMSMREKF